MAQHEGTGRHLRAVPDQPTDDDIPLGVTWQADPDERNPREKRGVPASEPLPPLQGRVVDTAEHNGALSPARISAAEITDKLKAQLEAGHTYALLAWTRRWDVAMGYVMDPALREQMLDEAEDELDAKRASAAKAARRAISPEDQVKAKRRADRLQRREVSELEVDARVLRARTARLVGKVAIPAAVIVGPVLLAATGAWVGLLVWPAAWGWLAVQGRAHARAELGAVPVATELEAKARQLAAVAPGAPVGTPAPAGQRGVRVVGADSVEAQILALLDQWGDLAPERGLADAAIGTVTAGRTGIEAVVNTSGKLTPAGLAKRVDAVRALLEVPTDIRIEIRDGARGDQALLKVRTRHLDIDTTWNPGRVGLGVNTDTGQPVDVSDDDRMLVCGASGSGKSWALRPLMARTVLSGRDHLVYIDGKGEEGRLWQGKGRVATSTEDIADLVEELCQEMDGRAEAMTGSVWTGPRIMAVIDEGRYVLANASKKTIKGLIDISSLGRSRGVVLRWCTQYPVTSGTAPGVHQQIAPNVDQMFSLRVKSETHARVALDDDADYGPQHIGLDQKGHGYLGEYGPTLIQTWTMPDKAVKALPDREPWEHTGDVDDDVVEQAPAGAEAPGVLDAAMDLMGASGGVRAEDVAEHMGVDVVDVYKVMQDLGVRASRYTPEPGQKQERGYPREALEEASGRYSR
ncbi:FtsK/SpoIIIE domain-containing protein [Nocardiopsis sp. CT-R113]|uniref:FtsK/SpoIIIE domain-containing protein n=1 Tax=Nocardiopsis codii TaxID=3065942 RepID=A0ABU7KFC5_9ACTN|nr:FtsK/SpoIIIE domain-containing protein [Nocardiopsis sp. CT-R113]MEE2040907.1 FtsK/SpoIIIE domain-containing protein [Nocardiopsis sp. CT-R113]